MENKNNYLMLTVEAKKNELNNIKLIEKIPVDILNLLINSSLLKQQFNNPFSSNCYDNEKQQLQKYKRLIKNGEATINYIQTKDIKFGRVFPKNSLGLFSIRREIRHTLARDNYIDIDIENCHPVLLSQICQNNNIEHKYLKKYIENRAELLKEVMQNYNVVKDQAKQLFIQLLYFGSFDSWCKNHNIENKEPLKFIRKFKKELNNIGEIIVANNPKLLKEIEKKKEEQHIQDYNIKGSVCSYFLQEYESRILETIYLYCKENKIINNSVVLCADGLMIPKENYKPELLNEFKNIIFEKMGFDLNFTKKEMDQGYTLEQLQETQLKTNEDDNITKSLENYNNIKIEFEKNNFKVLNPIMFVTIGENDDIILRSKKEFKDVYENLNYFKWSDYYKKMVQSSFIDDWLKDADMRTYYKLDFLPRQEVPDNVYNTFTGFEAEKKELFNIDIEDTLLMKHIKNICGNSQEFTEFFIKWLANMVQKPLKMSSVMVLFSSVQGVGKDSIFNYMGHKILGSKYYVNEDKTDLLFGRFNSLIENKILIVLNEASSKDTFKIDNNIKNAITRTTNTIEHKGLKPYEIKNCSSYVGLSNSSVSFKIEPTDRRFTAQESNEDIANDTEYFNALYDELNSGKIDRAFYEYLMKQDLNNYEFQKRRPQTKLYNDMKEACIPLIAKYLGNIIDDNQSLEELDYKANDFYSKFNDYVKAGNYKYETNFTQFGRELNDYNSIQKVKKRDGVHYIINLIELKEHLIKSKVYNDNIPFIDDEMN